MKSFKKVLVANRGEIAIRVFRACTDLNIRTVAIYSEEDTGSYHRYKADEAYLVGVGKKPAEAYLDIEDIIMIAKRNDVDAIHPGYGFLSENAEFARRCEEEGIKFIGPKVHHLEMFGDKVKAREQAILSGLPIIPGEKVNHPEDVYRFAEKHGFPVIIKASLGGGGRGMRIVKTREDVPESLARAKSEAQSAFGSGEVYVEKFIPNPKHIEVQILADEHGQMVHLYDRDCSVQRRHQKLVEIAPSVSLSKQLQKEICEAALRLMKDVNYVNAGTVEFLVSGDDFYFIEVNPRIQVEHTVTEMVTGIDIVQAQILIAEGKGIHSEEVGIPQQEDIRLHGFAIQCRITTEDPLNHFLPDTGKITVYRSSGGFGVRLDAGDAFQGAIISPYYDSLLVKVSVWGQTLQKAAAKMVRNLQEFRIRGIKTNIPFLENVVSHPKFLNGEFDTAFVDETPELFVFPKRQDRGTKLLTYISDVTVNGFPGIGKREKQGFEVPRLPEGSKSFDVHQLSGTKQLLDRFGPDYVSRWVKDQKKVLLTDTTLRDAHQSLLATRLRTYDMERVATDTARILPNLFSLEMWGGATFDVCYRFLLEDPWERLARLRKKIPNILFQMLLRGANAVGYKNYPDNVLREFIQLSAEQGIDVFRIFDSLNWVKGMEVAIQAVRDANKIAEVSICYTGNLLDPTRRKYDLNYYVDLAKELEKQGAHILAIKDMAGLLKPEAAYMLVHELKNAIHIPIHLHMHDTSGNGIYSYARAIQAGVDIVDVAVSALSGSTSQPSAGTLYHALEGTERQPDLDIYGFNALSRYWEDVRKQYAPFESSLNVPHPEIYEHEMPGGQYTNLLEQAKAVGLGNRFEEVKEMYRRVNLLFGDIVKVTPSSKVVGDMALFMVQNHLTEEDVIKKGESINFPESVVEFFQGYIGFPPGGFPKDVERVVLKNRKPLEKRAGELMPPVNFTGLSRELEQHLKRKPRIEEILSYCLYPKVYLDFQEKYARYGDLSCLDTPTFFYGMKVGEELAVEIERGKTLFIKLVSIGEAKPDGSRTLYFELNGQMREVLVRDYSVKTDVKERQKADPNNPHHIGATMPGTVVKLLVQKGDHLSKGDPLAITEAMKMETTLQAPFNGMVEDIFVKEGDPIQQGDLLILLVKK